MNSRTVIVSLLLVVFSSGLFAQQTSQTIDNLRSFNKLYGYVRFFHPSDEANAIDWDKFAVYGAGKVKNCKNSLELKEALEQLFLPIAPTIQIYFDGDTPRPLATPKDTSELKIVAWQHLGVGFGKVGETYGSVRLNRETTKDTLQWLRARNTFATIIQAIDITKYRGMQIRLSVHARANVKGQTNYGQLWIRMDKEKNQGIFLNDLRDKPIVSDEWRQYEVITATVPEEARSLVFGAYLSGEGQLWVDEFQLSYKDGERWKPLKINNPGFEKEITGDADKDWYFSSPVYTAETVEDNPYKGKKSLLIQNIPPEKFSGELFNKWPQIGEVTDKEIGAGLRCRVPLVLYSDDKYTFGTSDPEALKRLLSDMSVLGDEYTVDSLDVRLADVVIAWNVLQHFYPYFDVVGADWDSELSLALQRSLADRNEDDFRKTLLQMCEPLKDGHSFVSGKNTWTNRATVPVFFDLIEGKVVVTISLDTLLHRGDVVLSVDGTDALALLKECESLISGSPQLKTLAALGTEFRVGEPGSKASFVIERGTDTMTLDVARTAPVFPPSEFGYQNIEEIDTGIYYVNINNASMPEIDSQIADIAKAKGVIFDLRGYTHGNHGVISYMIDEPVRSAHWNVPMIIYPDRENIAGWDTSGRWLLEPGEPRIKGKIVFLTDARAISAAESFMGIIEYYKLAEIVGRPTAGTNGNVITFELPGGFTTRFTGMKVLKHDGSQHHLIGIKPTVPVERTIKAVREGRDEYIEKALELINEN